MLTAYQDPPDAMLGDVEVRKEDVPVQIIKQVKRFTWEVELEDLPKELQAYMQARLAVAMRTEQFLIPPGTTFQVSPLQEGGETYALRFNVVVPEER